MTRILLVGDIHLCDRPPSLRKPGYSDQILDKLVYTSQIARDEKVDAVVWAGDIFHVKSPSRTSHALVQRVIDVGNSYPCPWFVVPGNHDITHDRLESLENQPLGVLFKAGAQALIGSHDGLGMFGLPWLQTWDHLERWMQAWQEADKTHLMVTHAPIFPPGQSVPYDFIDAMDWAKLMDRPGEVYYGHIHDPHGTYEVTYQKKDGDLVTSEFCNQGALSRGSLHESTLKRKPAVTVYDSTIRHPQFQRIEVPHYPVEEVFALEARREAEQQQARLSDFLASVGTTELQQFDVATVLAHIDTLELKPRTRQQIEECLEVAVDAGP